MRKTLLSVFVVLMLLGASVSPTHAMPSKCFAIVNSASGQFRVRDDFQHTINTIIAPLFHTTPGTIMSALAHDNFFSNENGTISIVCQ